MTHLSAKSDSLRFPIINHELHTTFIPLVGELIITRDEQTMWWYLHVGDGTRTLAQLERILIDESQYRVDVEVMGTGNRVAIVTFWPK